jgi:hypothetical protein
MSALYTCKSCLNPQELVPPLSRRTGPDGQPMTKAHALFLFCHDGECVDCYLQRRDHGPPPVRRTWPSLCFPDLPNPRNWVTLRTA